MRVSGIQSVNMFAGAKSKGKAQAKSQIKPEVNEPAENPEWSKATPGERTPALRTAALLAALGMGVTAPAGVYRVSDINAENPNHVVICEYTEIGPAGDNFVPVESPDA